MTTTRAGRLAPSWLTEVGQELQQLLQLPENWNSYRARPIKPEVVAAARELLRDVARVDTPRPIVTPTVRGGVQLEWHTRGIDLEIELESPDRCQILFEDSRENTVYEAELCLPDTPRLAELVARLSQ